MAYNKQMRFLLLFLLLAATPALAQSQPAAPKSQLPTTSGSGMALEGDLLSVNGAAVKLWGIDAPDAGQKCRTKQGREYDCFMVAKNTMAGIIGKNQITCYIRGKDHNGQSIGTCAIQGLDLAALIVRAGWAMALRSLATQYGILEAEAQAKNRGLWAGPVEAPWEWRIRQQAEKKRNK